MKFHKAESSREEPFLNLVPLIDVVLVILIFLSVTTTFSQTAQLKIDLPEADAAAPVDAAPKEWVVAITADGAVFVGERAVGLGSVEDIESALRAVIPSGSQPTIIIEADAKTPHQRVIDVMANVEGRDLGSVVRDIEGQIKALGPLAPPMKVRIRGQNEVMTESFRSLGGGLIIVPVLVLSFHAQGVAPDIITHLALGTSLPTMIFTGFSSLRAHQEAGAVDWVMIRRLGAGMLVGAWLGGMTANLLSASTGRATMSDTTHRALP